jgi:hypothetical protein
MDWITIITVEEKFRLDPAQQISSQEDSKKENESKKSSWQPKTADSF